ncbi:MAG TPA: MFS transporter [Brachybacterium sp.]|nr:MFS transporter [Brachybacterium sp.]
MNRVVVATLTAAMALGIAVFFTLYSLIPVTRADDPALSSLFVGVMMACVLAVQVFTPALVRRFSLRLVIAVPLAVLALGALMAGTAQGTLLLLAGAVLSGTAFGILVVAGAQGVALLVPPTHLGRALGAYGLVTMAATALGSPAGVQLALTFSEAFFGVCAALAGLLGAGLALRLPRGVGAAETEPATAAEPGPSRGLRRLLAGAPWLALALLLSTVILLSHGLTSLPVLATAFSGAAVVVFAVQAGNALGRGFGGEVEARAGAPVSLGIGALCLAVGGVLGVLGGGAVAVSLAGALIGLGVGIVQTVVLHVAMHRMAAGSASVVWNLAVDGGLWTGGILWGAALASGLVGAGAVVVSLGALALGAAVAVQLRRRG